MSDKKIIITLGRECGSGGHEIGEKLSKKLGIAFYDKNLIELACTDDCGSAVQGAERCDP